MHLSNSTQSFLWGSKSGDLDDHGRTSILFLCRNAVYIRAVCLVLLKGSAVILHNWKDMLLQNFVTISLSCQIIINVYQVDLSSMRYGWPHHYASATESVDFLDTVSSKTFTSNVVNVVTGTWIYRWTRLSFSVWAHLSLFWRCYWLKKWHLEHQP